MRALTALSAHARGANVCLDLLSLWIRMVESVEHTLPLRTRGIVFWTFGSAHPSTMRGRADSLTNHARFSAACARSGSSSPGRLEQEPCATFRLVDPVFDQAGRGDIAVLVADIAGLPHAPCEHQVVFLQLGQHVFRCDEIRFIVLDAFHPRDVADRAD